MVQDRPHPPPATAPRESGLADAHALGARLRRYRQARGWSQEELAVRAGWAPSYQANIAAIEAGTRRAGLTVLRRLACALQISTSQLLGEDES